MKRLILICLLIVLVYSTSFAQSITLSDAQLTMPAPPKIGETQALWGVGCTLTEPITGCSLMVLAGSDNDKNDVGTGKATFYKVENTWQVLPADVRYVNNKIWIGLPLELSRQGNVKVFTLYVIDKKGVAVSNRLYYTISPQ